ncbi:MAG: choice-of-anchor D domain-containing protein, partial [Planctomycetes bacterium]|nr:choice-of-anchor D domain-containing protein [Planctomycetota bacterium]
QNIGFGLEELRFDAEYGDVIQCEIQTTTTDLLGQPLDTAGQVLPYLFNRNGSYIPLELISDIDAADDPMVFEFTSYNEGTNYLYLQYFTSPNEQMKLDLTIRETNNILSLVPGDFAQIPVWFTPQNTGQKLEYLHFALDTGIGDLVHEIIELKGAGIPGDYAIKDLQLLDQMFSNQVQSGMPLTVTGIVSNMGPGDITESTQVRLVLSTDDELGNDDDIILDQTANIDPLFVNQAFTYNITVNVPAYLEGNYYLMAVVDPEHNISEYPLDDGIHPNISISDRLEISANSLIVADSVDDQFDNAMNYGVMDLGSFRVEIISLHNRSSSPVNLVSMDLTSDFSFQPFGLENPVLFQSPINIQPGSIEHIPIVFAPDAFPPSGAQFASGEFNFSTDENLDYSVSLSGMLGGPDLIVRLPEFDDRIDALQFDPTPVGQLGEALPIEIFNLGNEPLVINDIMFINGSNSAFSLSGESQIPFQLMPHGSEGDFLSFMVEFTPTTLSHFVDTIVISSNVDAGDYQIRLDGQGVAPKLKVYDNQGAAADDKNLPFGWQPVGQPTQAIVTLVNEGNYTLQIFDWFLDNDNPDDFSVSPLNLQNNASDNIILNPQGSFELIVTFNSPSEGLFSDTLVINSNDGNRLVELSSLSGESTQPSLEFVYLNQPFENDETLAFGSVPVGQSLSRQLRLRNDGLVEVQISQDDLNIFGAGLSFTAPELFNAPNGELSLQPGDYFGVNVRFDANVNLGVGSFNGYLVADSTSPETMNLALTTTTVTPEITVNDSINFGALTPHQQATLPLNIVNNGSADLIITQWYIDDDQFEIQIPAEKISNNKIIIAPNQALTADVICQPTIFGFTQASLSLVSNDLDESLNQIGLSVYNMGEQIEVLPGSPRSFRDLNNQLVNVSITEGRAIFSLDNGSIGGANIDTINIFDSTDSTKLNISVRGGEQTTVGAVNSNDDLASINAPKVNLTDFIDVNGSLEQLNLANIGNFANITVNQPADNPMTVKLDNIGQHVNIDFAGDLKLFQADTYETGNLNAGAISNLNIKQGNFGANVMTLNLNKLNVQGNISGSVQALNDIGKVISKNGAISGELIAQNGSIDKVIAPLEISGGIYAQNILNSVTVKNGDLSAELRAHTINNVKADGLDNAVISAWYINKVKVNVDAVDSYLLAGFDIGMKGIDDPTDDYLFAGELGSFRFGGEIRNTFVAAGAMPDRIYDSLLLPKAAGAPSSAGIGSIGSIKGNAVVTDSGEPEFGF